MSTVQHINNPNHSEFGQHRTISWSEAARSSEERLRAIQNISSTLQQGDMSFASKEKGFLENTIKLLESFSKSIDEFIKHEEENIKKIRDEVLKYYPDQTKNDSLTSQMKREIIDIEKKIHAIMDYQRAVSQKRKDISNKIDTTELSKIKFKDFQDDSNDIFKWCLQAIYNESKSSYAWPNFKKQVFILDKGEDFLLRLKGLNLQKLKKDDFLFAKAIMDKKNPYLAEIERGKENNSLRRLLEYIDTIVEYSKYHDECEAEKEVLEQKLKEFDLKMIEFQKVGNTVHMLEHKMNDSHHYIEALNRLKPYLISNISATKERLNSAIQHSNLTAKAMHPNIQSQENHPKVYEDDGPQEEENTARDVNHVYPNVRKGESKFSKGGNNENCSLF